MDVSVADAKNRLSELLRSVEAGEAVRITPPEGPVVRFGTMRRLIHFTPGWDDPIDIERFLLGDF
jgi:antitoxin (DNA-binding transcriptional repressor) of toxin-antitoxin stability system